MRRILENGMRLVPIVPGESGLSSKSSKTAGFVLEYWAVVAPFIMAMVRPGMQRADGDLII